MRQNIELLLASSADLTAEVSDLSPSPLRAERLAGSDCRRGRVSIKAAAHELADTEAELRDALASVNKETDRTQRLERKAARGQS
ncbi:hypothetical protein KCP69_09080 [Salmonella enterica subsp. enterica]|nr:hypothetical protein KCP69_09080 [Salmonella enterica subsp. enterica]